MITVSTSTASVGKPSYHHGDLQAAVLVAGLEMLERRRSDELSLREIARAVGVSATALYRHFPDKNALLGALATEGFNRLGAAQAHAQTLGGPGPAGFKAAGRAYVDFARANPALFRLMFSHAPHADKFQTEAPNAGSPMALLRNNAAAFADPKGGPNAQTVFCARAWALVHGLATLLLDRQLELDDALIDAVLAERPMAATGAAEACSLPSTVPTRRSTKPSRARGG